MGELDPVAFDIETSGLHQDAIVTVVGFSHELGNWLMLNTGGREGEGHSLEQALSQSTENPVTLTVVTDEKTLLLEVADFVDEKLTDDAHYLTAYNGERWNGGFDLPFLRSAYLHNSVSWPFTDIAYADMMDAIERFDTNDVHDLCGVYDSLVGEETCDPFDESGAAVEAFESGDWLPLLRHNLADIERTRELAALAERFVPQSDFSMKNLAPPG